MKHFKQISKAALFLYAALMIYLLFFMRFGVEPDGTYWEKLSTNVNVIPFSTVKDYINTFYDRRSTAIINLAGNIVMFIPLGFLLPCVCKKVKSYVKTLAYSMLIILAVELIQLFTLLGAADIDDLILNLAGVSLGYAFYVLFIKNKD